LLLLEKSARPTQAGTKPSPSTETFLSEKFGTWYTTAPAVARHRGFYLLSTYWFLLIPVHTQPSTGGTLTHAVTSHYDNGRYHLIHSANYIFNDKEYNLNFKPDSKRHAPIRQEIMDSFITQLCAMQSHYNRCSPSGSTCQSRQECPYQRATS
jgi:hypothetical protein